MERFDYAPGGFGYDNNLVDMQDVMKLPCGGIAYYDENSGISHRCAHCNAVVGSIAQPQSCKDEAAKWELQKLLGGKGWDYTCSIDDWE